MSEEKLLNCPFCQSDETYMSSGERYPERRNPKYYYYRECSCGAKGEPSDTKEGADENWNTRQPDRISELEAQLNTSNKLRINAVEYSKELEAEIENWQTIASGNREVNKSLCKEKSELEAEVARLKAESELNYNLYRTEKDRSIMLLDECDTCTVGYIRSEHDEARRLLKVAVSIIKRWQNIEIPETVWSEPCTDYHLPMESQEALKEIGGAK